MSRLAPLLLALTLAAPVAAQVTPPAPVVEPDAKAVVTLDNGEPIPAEWPAGINIPMSYANSVVGARGIKSAKVIVKPDWLQKYTRVRPESKTLEVPVGNAAKTVTVTLKVAYRDTFDEATYTVRIVPNPDDPTPEPGPAPPNPAPVPQPPGPAPAPPGPVVTDKLRVILLYDSTANNTRDQLTAIYSTTIPAYLNAHCTTDTGRLAWRFWDKSVDATKESATWQAALAAAKADPKPLPKVVVFAGETVLDSYPVTTADATLENIKIHGGH